MLTLEQLDWPMRGPTYGQTLCVWLDRWTNMHIWEGWGDNVWCLQSNGSHHCLPKQSKQRLHHEAYYAQEATVGLAFWCLQDKHILWGHALMEVFQPQEPVQLIVLLWHFHRPNSGMWACRVYTRYSTVQYVQCIACASSFTFWPLHYQPGFWLFHGFIPQAQLTSWMKYTFAPT